MTRLTKTITDVSFVVLLIVVACFAAQYLAFPTELIFWVSIAIVLSLYAKYNSFLWWLTILSGYISVIPRAFILRFITDKYDIMGSEDLLLNNTVAGITCLYMYLLLTLYMFAIRIYTMYKLNNLSRTMTDPNSLIKDSNVVRLRNVSSLISVIVFASCLLYVLTVTISSIINQLLVIGVIFLALHISEDIFVRGLYKEVRLRNTKGE